jgi:hypothetical protein
VRGSRILRTSPFGDSQKFAFKEFCELRHNGVLRSSRLQSPPAQPRSSNYRTTLRPLWTQNRSLVTTIVARIRYERLRLPTLIVPENFHNFDAPWDRGKASFSKGWYLAKDAPRRVVQAEGDPLLRRGALLALSANYVKGRLRLCIGSVTEPGILRTSRLRRSKKSLPASNSKLQQR